MPEAQGTHCIPLVNTILLYRVLQPIFSFPGMTEDDMFQYNVKFTGLLKLNKDCSIRVVATEKLGKPEHWSSDGLYRHLCVLNTIIPRVGELYTKRLEHKYQYLTCIGSTRMKRPRAPGLNSFSFAYLEWCHMASNWFSTSSDASRLQVVT